MMITITEPNGGMTMSRLRQALQDEFVERIVEDMDIEELRVLAMEYLDEQYDKVSYGELMDKVAEFYPDMLEDSEIAP
jgi:GTP cyclohydrolase FolE2